MGWPLAMLSLTGVC